MKTNHHSFIRVLTGALLALGLMGPLCASAEEKKDLVLREDAVCTKCHDESEAYPVLPIAKTKHGTVADGRTPTCVSCHGQSSAHVNNQRPEGQKDRPKTDRNFKTFNQASSNAPGTQVGQRSRTSAEQMNEACTTCHKGKQHVLWQGSQHDQAGVACVNCHQVHSGHDRVRDKSTQAEVCYACHKEQRAQMNRPSRHPVKEGLVACSDCHNTHGSAGPKLLVKDSVVDTCYSCHMEKRGPFIYNHQPVTEDCGNCHNPHGTVAPNLLKVQAPFLCQSCHEATSHRGGIPANAATGNISGSSGMGATYARGCLNCHQNIHGSNNHSNHGEARSLRR